MVSLVVGGLRRMLLCGLEGLLRRYLNLFGFVIDVGKLMSLFVQTKLTIVSFAGDGEGTAALSIALSTISLSPAISFNNPPISRI